MKSWSTLLLSLALLVSCGHDKNAVYVKNLKIVGNKELGDGAIKDGLATQELCWVPFTDRIPFDELSLQRDLSRVEAFYRDHGFFQAQLLSHQVKEAGKKRVAVTIEVKEGPPHLIRKVIVEPWDLSSEVKSVAEELRKLEGHRFDREKYVQLKEEYRLALLNAGYCESSVKGQVRVYRDQDTVEVALTAKVGPQCFLGGVLMRGDVDVGADIILRHSQLKRGMLVTPSILKKSERGVYSLGLFSMVRLEINEREEEADTTLLTDSDTKLLVLPEKSLPDDVGPHKWVNVTLYAQKKPLREFTVGGGVGFDRSSQQARLKASWSNRNFFGGLRTFSVHGVAGYTFLPAVWDRRLSGPSGEVGVSFVQPGFLDPALTLASSATYLLAFEEAFQYHAPQGRVGLERPLYWDLKGEIFYEVTYYDFFNVRSSVLEEKNNPLGHSFVDPFLLTTLTEAVTWDARDHPLVTRNGVYARVSFTQALKALGADFQFLKVVGDLRGYYTPWKWVTLAARVMNGYAWGLGKGESVPIISRFFSGGANSVRGFDFQRLSPYAEKCDADGTNCQRAPVGGVTLVLTQLETRFHLPWNISTVLFTDIGNVFEQEFNPDVTDLTYNAGVGLRYLTPVGPIRLDFAFRLYAPQRYDYLAPWTFYITLGEAF